MLTATGCAARRQAVQAHFSDHDLLLLSSPAHIFYLSGFIVPPTELAGDSLNFLLIDRTGHTCLVADNLARAATQVAFVDQVEIWPWDDRSQPARDRFAAALDRLSQLLKKQYAGVKRVAVEYNHLPAAAGQFESAKVADLGPTLYQLRRSKYEDELACIGHAIRATEAGHAAARRVIRPGLTELDLYAEVQAAITLAAGGPIVMRGGFAGGRRSEAVGGPPTNNLLQAGDLMILDLYPVIGGYRADLANTLCVGQPDQAQLEHMAALQAALQAVESRLRPGVTGGELDSACRDSLKQAGLAEAFPHHTGHGLGLSHPEPPYLVPGGQDRLQVGDVVAIEPGAYIAGWGGARIEHNYLVTGPGYERLSHHLVGL